MKGEEWKDEEVRKLDSKRFAQENTVGLCQDWDLLGEMLSPSRGVGTEEKCCFSF